MPGAVRLTTATTVPVVESDRWHKYLGQAGNALCSCLVTEPTNMAELQIISQLSKQRTAASIKPRVSWSSVRSIVKTKKQKLPGISGLENQLKLRWGGLYLHGYGEVVLRLRREEDVNSFLLEGRIPSWRCPDLDDVKLSTSGSSYGKTEEGRPRREIVC